MGIVLVDPSLFTRTSRPFRLREMTRANEYPPHVRRTKHGSFGRRRATAIKFSSEVGKDAMCCDAPMSPMLYEGSTGTRSSGGSIAAALLLGWWRATIVVYGYRMLLFALFVIIMMVSDVDVEDGDGGR